MGRRGERRCPDWLSDIRIVSFLDWESFIAVIISVRFSGIPPPVAVPRLGVRGLNRCQSTPSEPIARTQDVGSLFCLLE